MKRTKKKTHMGDIINNIAHRIQYMEIAGLNKKTLSKMPLCCVCFFHLEWQNVWLCSVNYVTRCLCCSIWNDWFSSYDYFVSPSKLSFYLSVSLFHYVDNNGFESKDEFSMSSETMPVDCYRSVSLTCPFSLCPDCLYYIHNITMSTLRHYTAYNAYRCRIAYSRGLING